MSYLIKKMTLPENLYWAWEKTFNLYKSYGGWYDEVELESFGANIKEELKIISDGFRDINYKMLPLKPILYPRQLDDKKGPQSRQWFWVPVRNQVAWIAFVNIVGPFLDYRMPNWSYGNRLYRPIWYEIGADNQREKKIGWYRNTSNKLYKTFNQSWNVYRRNIFYTACKMTTKKNCPAFSQEEKDELKHEELLPDKLKLAYLRQNFWKNKSDKIYWMGIDFEKFYPNINLNVISENLIQFMPVEEMSDNLARLLKRLLDFPVDLAGYSNVELRAITLDPLVTNIECVPTGLFVSGFLANVSMMKVDSIVNDLVEKQQIAHFRYVDDHIMLSQSFDNLIDWKKQYEEILKKHVPSVHIKLEKTKPDGLKKYFEGILLQKKELTDKKNIAKKESELDPRFPTPLMTKTLAHISGLADLDPDLLDDNEQKRLLGDLEHLLLSDFPENELREDTRISFAASMISRVAKKRFPHLSSQNVYFLDREINKLKSDFKLLKDQKMSRKSKKSRETIRKQIQDLELKIREKERQLFEEDSARLKYEEDEKQKIFYLLLKALEEHPEKVRIWERVFQYCQYVGYKELEPVFSTYKRLCKTDTLNISYYRALILQIIGGQLISCSKTILDKDELFYRREAAFDYLISVLDVLDGSGLYCDANHKYYELYAKYLFECACGTMWLSLSKMKNDGDGLISPQNIKKIETFCNRYQLIKWTSPMQWVRKRNHTLSEWVWWAEGRTTRSVSCFSGVVLKTVVSKLDENDSISLLLWKRYPSEVAKSKKAIKKVISLLKNHNAKAISSSEGGWMLEMLMAVRKEQGLAIIPNMQAVPILFKVKKALKFEQKDYINLFVWVNELEKLYEKDPFNTRLTEWTALKIAKKICLLINSIAGAHLKKTINPANFLLPNKWLDLETQPDSWKSWGEMLDREEIKPSNELIEDSRYTPIFLGELSDVEYAPVRGMSLLLLGLLTRSFRLPAVWNPQGQRLARNYVLGKMIGSCKCSSWTNAILWGCFSPKVRETVLFEQLQNSIFSGLTPANDTTIDPPKIIDLNQFVKYLDQAISTLGKYQISVYQNKPMQLTPINVKQLSFYALNEQEVMRE